MEQPECGFVMWNVNLTEVSDIQLSCTLLVYNQEVAFLGTERAHSPVIHVTLTLHPPN